MENEQTVFQFKQFSVLQQPDVFKVNTDGCLLGAVVCDRVIDLQTAPSKPFRILDIGTGTGVIALMLAQCYTGEIDAVDINPKAIALAKHNFLESNWSDCLNAIHTNADELARNGKSYQLIVSNPPFFTSSLKSPFAVKNQAKHNDILPPEKLINAVSEILDPTGSFFTIYPPNEAEQLIALGKDLGLFLKSIIEIKPVEHKPVHRYLMEFSKDKSKHPEKTILIIQQKKREYTSEHKALLKDFFLNL